MDLSPRFDARTIRVPPHFLCVLLLQREQHSSLSDDETGKGLGTIPAHAGSDTPEAAMSNSGQTQPRWTTIARRLITISSPHAP